MKCLQKEYQLLVAYSFAIFLVKIGISINAHIKIEPRTLQFVRILSEKNIVVFNSHKVVYF